MFTPLSTQGRCDSTIYEGMISSSNGLCNEVAVRGISTYGCECTVTPTSPNVGNVVVGELSSYQSVRINNATHAAPAAGTIRVASGDFEAPRTYTCPTGPFGCAGCDELPGVFPTLAARTADREDRDRPALAVSRAGAPCDTVTVTGVGVTAVQAGRR